MIGASLGPYEILEPLGKGGMGEVYLGEDSRLGRKVAIKVLPAEFATDPERLARFEQEARAAAALNHPHIAVVHDVGAETGDDGVVIHFMVQEYLEGQSLGQRLDKGALPLDKALDLATEVGDALVAAHKAGIIHRDLKPDNIFVTEQGHAKVLDFGLAKLTEVAAPVGSELSMSPTMLGTVAGQVMGTAGYMAPEQINGDPVDQRADLFAFGCVLYGMVTGRQAFGGRNVHETLGHILSDEPAPIVAADKSLPHELQRIVRKLLAKEADRRYQTASDLNVDLRQLEDDIAAGVAGLSGSSEMAVDPGAAGTVRGIPWKLAAPIAVAIALLAALGAWVWIPSPPEPLTRRFDIDYPAGTSLYFASSLGVAISPDGRWVVFNADGQLWRRAIDDLLATPIAGTEEGKAPFFSPDSQQLGFWGGDGQIKRVSITGGEPVSLGRASGYAFGASWADDDHIYFGLEGGGIWRISDIGGEPQTVLETEEGEQAYGPQLLPGGEWVLFTLRSGTGSWNDARIVAQPVAGGERKPLVAAGTDGRYLPTGHIVYSREGALFAVPFDAESMEVTGGSVSIVEGVQQGTGATGASQYAFSDRGGMVYLPSGATPVRTLSWFDREGNEEQIAAGPRLYYASQVSPDGEAVAIDVLDAENRDIWVLDLGTDALARVTRAPGDDSYPVWDPDGSRVFTGSVGDGARRSLFWISADGAGQPERLTTSTRTQVPYDVSPDGSRLVFGVQGADIWMLSLEDDPLLPEALIATEFAERSANVSPDGNWIAYESDESGATEVWVRPFPDVNAGRWQLSQGGGAAPVWSPDNQEVFYWRHGTETADLMVVRVETEPSFSPERATILFSATGVYRSGLGRTYDIDPDGQRFFVVMEGTDGEETRPRINVVLDWFEELRRLVPTGR